MHLCAHPIDPSSPAAVHCRLTRREHPREDHHHLFGADEAANDDIRLVDSLVRLERDAKLKQFTSGAHADGVGRGVGCRDAVTDLRRQYRHQLALREDRGLFERANFHAVVEIDEEVMRDFGVRPVDIPAPAIVFDDRVQGIRACKRTVSENTYRQAAAQPVSYLGIENKPSVPSRPPPLLRRRKPCQMSTISGGHYTQACAKMHSNAEGIVSGNTPRRTQPGWYTGAHTRRKSDAARGDAVMESNSKPRTYFEELPTEALLHVARFSMRSFPDGYPDEYRTASQSCYLLRLADEAHPLHNASVELLDELTMHAAPLCPKKDEHQFFAVYGPGCSSLKVRGHFGYHPGCFLHLLNSCRSLKQLEVECWNGGDVPFRPLLLAQESLEELNIRSFRDLAYAADAVTAFGQGLKRLDIELSLTHGTAITRLFEAAGLTLESLRINVVEDDAGPDAYRFDLRTISGWCPLVKNIFVQCPHNLTEQGTRSVDFVVRGSA